ncbi:MAG: hypothetical protein WDO56_05175 [Gammaproteobacteria bacterium]
MSQFEMESIAVLKQQLWAFVAADSIALLALFAALVGGYLTYKSVRVIAQQLELSRWNTLLLFEQDMAGRRLRFHDISAELEASAGASTESIQKRFDEARENYFNSLDRLASSILNAHFPDSEMKQDYHEALTEVIRAFPDDFGTGTRYRKIVKLYNRWQDR